MPAILTFSEIYFDSIFDDCYYACFTVLAAERTFTGTIFLNKEKLRFDIHDQLVLVLEIVAID